MMNGTEKIVFGMLVKYWPSRLQSDPNLWLWTSFQGQQRCRTCWDVGSILVVTETEDRDRGCLFWRGRGMLGPLRSDGRVPRVNKSIWAANTKAQRGCWHMGQRLV